MRVVAGELGGRRLISPHRGTGVRPTSDRVREALFSILGDVSGLDALDLFCGTGAMAIEALSRGARGAVLVDSHTAPAQRNLEALDLSERATLVRADARAYLRRSRERFDLVFCDPPYKLADRLGRELDQLLPARLAPGARVIVESAVRRPLELSLPIVRERAYGQTLIRVHAGEGR